MTYSLANVKIACGAKHESHTRAASALPCGAFAHVGVPGE